MFLVFDFAWARLSFARSMCVSGVSFAELTPQTLNVIEKPELTFSLR